MSEFWEKFQSCSTNFCNTLTAMYYLFNLLMGIGIIILPGSYSSAGWFLGSIFIVCIGFVSWLSASFLIEAQACANRIRDYQKGEMENDYSLRRNYDVKDIIMLFLTTTDRIFFLFIIMLELLCEMVVLNIVVGKSLTHLICGNGYNLTLNYLNDETCGHLPSNTNVVYKISVLSFVTVAILFSFFHRQNLWPIQYIAGVYRVFVIFAMIINATYRLINNDGNNGDKNNKEGVVRVFSVLQLPTMIGTTVVSFMCHHSLLWILRPVKRKDNIQKLIACVYFVVVSFYVIISIFAVLTFKRVDEIFTMDFFISENDTIFIKILNYAILFYPIISGFSVFLILNETFEEYLKVFTINRNSGNDDNGYFCWFVKKCFVPLLGYVSVIVPLCTKEIRILLPIFGCYLGNLVQNVLPLILVQAGRKFCLVKLAPSENKFSSPLKHKVWPVIGFLWVAISLFFTTITLIPFFLKM